MSTNTVSDQKSQSETEAALRQAEEFGVDLSLLRSNLRLTPTERVQRAQAMLDSIMALKAEAQKWRIRKKQKN